MESGATNPLEGFMVFATARGLGPKGSGGGNGDLDGGKDGLGRRLGKGGFLPWAQSIPAI